MAELVDYLGRPIRSERLRQEHAAATLTGVRQPYHDSVAFDMSPPRLARILRDAAQGDGHDFLTYAEEIEGRDLHYRSVMTQRKAAVASLPVTIAPASEASHDTAIAADVQHLTEAPDFAEMLFHCLDALGKGYSMVELVWDSSETQWWPAFRHRDPRYFQLDKRAERFRLRRNRNDDGAPLAPFKWIQHVPRLLSAHPLMSGLARPVAVHHLFKSLGVRDWAVYAEVFGMPVRLGKYPEGTSEDDIATLQRAVAGLGADASAVLKDGMEIEFPGASVTGGGPAVYENKLRWHNQEISKGVLGQTMTTEDGASLSQAEVHERILATIGRGDARALEATLQRDLVRPFVDLNHGPQRRYPQLTLVVEDPEDVEAWTRAATEWADRGLVVPVRTVREKLGVPEPEEGEDVLGPKAGASTGLDNDSAARPDPALGAELNALTVRFLRRVDAGDELTTTQLRVLELCLSRQGDAIDELVDQAVDHGWRRMMEPVVGPIAELAAEAEDYQDLLARLDDQVPDLTRAQRQLAIATFKARGVGNARDDA